MNATGISKIALVITGFTVFTSYSGQWEIFTCKNDVRDIALKGNTLWAATVGGVVKWNFGDNSYESFTTSDGLSSCDVNHIAIDKKGQPWVTTKNPTGLFVFENHIWKQMNVGGTDHEIRDKFMYGLEVDRFGNVWVWDSYGLWCYDGHSWHRHKGVKGPLALDLQKNLLAVDSLFSTDNYHTLRFRIVSYNGSGFVGKCRGEVHGPGWTALANIALDSKGNPWISYYDDRGYEKPGVVGNNTLYTKLDGLADDNVRSITTDRSGTVWCATDGGISKFTGSGWVTYDTTKGVASNCTYKILTGSNDTLYAATSKGISILKTEQWKTLKTINEPSHNNYTDMVVGRNDEVILAGYDHIARYNDSQWKMNYFRNIRIGDSYYRHFPSRSNSKSFIKSKDGTVYAIGNEIEKEGCIMKQGTGGSTFLKALSLPLEKRNRFLSPVIVCSGNNPCFWLTDRGGNLILLNKQTPEIFPPSRFGVEVKSTVITCMLLDQDGRSVWAGYKDRESYDVCLAGIVHFDGDTVKKKIDGADGFFSVSIPAIVRDSSENLWFASSAIRYRSGEVALLRNSKLTTYRMDSYGKVFGGCNALFVDKLGMVWAHADNGIARFNGSSWKLFDSTAVSPDLPYARYSHIIQDKSGTVWFGTEGSGLLTYKDDRWYQFTTHDGIPSNSIRSCSFDSKDNLWILTDNGIAMRKSDGTVHNRERRVFRIPGNEQLIRQCGSRFYVSSKDKPKMIRYTLFDLRGRVLFRRTIHGRNSFMVPESNTDFGSGLRILSITLKDFDGSQNKVIFKVRGFVYL